MRYCLLLDIFLGAFFGNSVTVLFYRHHGLTLSQALTVQASLSFATVVADIPAGHVADRFGVPVSILIGTVMQTVQSVFFVPLRGFWSFEFLAIGTGVSWCFLLNTTSSIVQSQWDKELFRTYKSRLARIRPLVWAGSSLLGGHLADRGGVDVPYIVQPFVNACAVVVAWRLLVLTRSMNIARPKHALWHSLKKAARTMLVERPAVRWLVLLTAVNNVSLLAGLWLLQPELKRVHVSSLTVFGALYALRALLAGAFGFWKRLTAMSLLKGQIVVYVVTTGTMLVVALSDGWIGVAALVVGNAFLASLLELFQEVGLNEMLPEQDQHRTTNLSVNTAVKSAVYFVVAWQLGDIVKHHSVGAAFLAIGCGVLTCGGAALWRLRVHVLKMDGAD